MPMLSPILLPNEKKNERQTKGLRGFYLVETSSGLRGIVGAIDPATLNRVQKTGLETARTSNSHFLHCVYWDETRLPELDLEENETRGNGSRISRIARASEAALFDFFSRNTPCLIGDEGRLDTALAEGEGSVPVALWPADDEKLPWLPCHRVLRDVEWFQSGWMVCLAREHMFFKDVTAELLDKNSPGSVDKDSIERLLISSDDETVTMLAVSRDGAWRIHSKSGWADGILEDLNPSLRETAVVQLHSIVLSKGLNLSPTDGSQEGRITVVHDSTQAVAALTMGAQVAYLLSPIRSAKLKELVQHGQMLPANSVVLDVAALESWMDAE